MNYYDARERKGADGKGTGKWHYTCENDGRIYPVGYCAQGCEGHDTPEEACEHYRQYLLNERTRYDGQLHGEQRECAVCGAWTQGVVYVDGWHSYVLCDEHRNREEMERLYPKVGQIMSS